MADDAAVPARIVIAIPVHNGGEDIRRCLDCLRRQTLRDFRAIVFENASTDGTLGLVNAVAAEDPRFEVRPSGRLLPVLENFDRAILGAQGLAPYFCLRAADDYTSDNFLERLVDALDQDPSRHLAVGQVLRVDPAGAKADGRDSDIQRVLDRRTMRNWRQKFPASWYYGVYRQGPATAYLIESRKQFPYVWGFDRLVIYKMLADFGVAYRQDAMFYCQMGSGGGAKYMAKTASEALARRISYYRAIMRMTAHRSGKGVAFDAMSRWTAWRIAGQHTTTRLKHILRLLRGKPPAD